MRRRARRSQQGPTTAAGPPDKSKIAKRLPGLTIWKKGSKATRKWKRRGMKIVKLAIAEAGEKIGITLHRERRE